MKPNAEAQLILDKNLYATLATVDAAGSPWNSLVYFVCDAEYHLYWASGVESHHSKNIAANGKVFIVVYDSTVPWGSGTGVYAQAVACEVTDSAEIAKVCELRAARTPQANQPPEAFMGASSRRIYRADLQQIWLNQGTTKDGQYLDILVEAAA